jgi:hypothetical protein
LSNTTQSAAEPVDPFLRTAAPTTSPWGPVQDPSELGPGVWVVLTARHAGIHLSEQRLAAMSDFMRLDGGWYGNDLDWAMVALIWPELFDFHYQAIAETIFQQSHPAKHQQLTAFRRAALNYEPAKLEIRRHRFSTTQGEVELIYDGRRLEQYGDAIQLQGDGQWRGRDDAYWHEAAQLFLLNQGSST